ncbi:MAG: MFS transporter [Bacteroidia bacterium]
MSTDNNKTIWKVIGASSVGTLIEWYDFYIFGSLATIISTHFFPKENPTAAFLATLAAFGVGFVIRPFGAIVFGRLGDIIGRKHTFLVTLLIMGGSTFAIGFIPDYDTIGMLAPVLVFVLRAVQGLALGGEYGGAATYVAEHAPSNKRGYFTSFIQTTATLGLLLSLGIILACKSSMSGDAFNDWGWRLPFIISIFLIAISFYIRLKMEESPVFAQLKAQGKTSKNPLKESFGNWANLKWVLIALFGATAGQGVVWYTGQFYAMNFCIKNLQIDAAQIQWMLIPVLLLSTPFFIIFASLSDRIGRKGIMLTGIFLAAITYMSLYKNMAKQADWKTWQQTEHVLPVTELKMNTAGDSLFTNTYNYLNGAIRTEKIHKNKADHFVAGATTTVLKIPESNLFNIGLLIFIQLLFVTMAYGPIAAFLVELFPARIRYTSMSLPYHIGNGVFGGLTPLIAESLVVKTNNIFAGLYYPICVALLTVVVGMLFIKKKGRDIIE